RTHAAGARRRPARHHRLGKGPRRRARGRPISRLAARRTRPHARLLAPAWRRSGALHPGHQLGNQGVRLQGLRQGSAAVFRPEAHSGRHAEGQVTTGSTDAKKEKPSKKNEAGLQRIKKGEDFAKVAREEGEKPSAKEGAAPGCSQRGAMVKPFEDAAYALSVG